MSDADVQKFPVKPTLKECIGGWVVQGTFKCNCSKPNCPEMRSYYLDYKLDWILTVRFWKSRAAAVKALEAKYKNMCLEIEL